MATIVDQQREAIASVCEQFDVERLFVFGSALRADFRPGKSDVDLLIEFKPMDGGKKVHAYFCVLRELKNLFQTNVDLVMAGAVKNRIIAKEIERTKQLVYGS